MRNRRPLIIIVAIAIAVVAIGAALFFVARGGGSSNCDSGTTWGGYDECEAKDVLKDPNVETQICQNAPGDPATSPVCQLYPTPAEVDAAELRRITFEGQEGWQWQHADQNFCIVVWEDPETKNFATLVSACVAD